MKAVEPWFDRKFETDVDSRRFHGLLERLDGTQARIAAGFRNLPAAVLTASPGDKWSVVENIGHLYDLEPLWLARVDELTKSADLLLEADLTNKRTHEANHNQAGFESVLDNFTLERRKLVARLLRLEEVDFEKRSLHPRLKIKMSIVDLMSFVAEHDDHHLAVCRYLLSKSETHAPLDS